MKRLRNALANGGDWVAVVAIVAAFAVAAFVVNPVKEAEQHVGEPIARSAGLLPSQCPGGWEAVNARDVHTVVETCKKDKWIVVLKPNGSFDYGFQIDTPGAQFIYDAQLVPGWSR